MNIQELHSFCHYRHPLVSVVVPLYNCEEYIEECILSIRKQDYKPIEIIVVDDASTDASVAKISEYPICILRNETNRGECKTSQRGFDAARGKYVCRLSCDDAYVNANHISIQVAEMEKYNLDWCYNNIMAYGPTTEEAVTIQTSFVPRLSFLQPLDNTLLNFPNYCYLVAIARNPIFFGSAMFRTDSFRKHLSWDNNLRTVCDGELLGQILLTKLKGRAINSVGAFWRMSNYQQTGKPETKWAYEKLRKILYDEVRYGNHPMWMKMGARILKETIG